MISLSRPLADHVKIPFEVAVALCARCRARNARKTLSFKRLWCWGCMKFSKGPAGRCFASDADGLNRGCPQVNRAFADARAGNDRGSHANGEPE